MQKFVLRSGVIACALASAMALAACAGCDDQRSADKQVLKNIRESRSKRLAGDEAAAQSLLAQAAQINSSSATQAHAKSLLAQSEVEAAIHQMNDPENGVEAGNSKIATLLYEIGALGQQIRTGNSLVAAYQQYNPAPSKALAEQHITSAQGGPDKLVWFGENANSMPTLAAVTQEIARLQGEIAKLQSQIKTLQTQQTDLSKQADQAGRAAIAAQGRAGVDAERKAADLRKKSADVANQIDVLQSKVAPLETDLAVARAREAALKAALQQFQTIAKDLDSNQMTIDVNGKKVAVEGGWKRIEQEVLHQQQLRTAIYQGVGGSERSASTNSITSKAVELDKVVQKTSESYASAEENLTNAVEHFGQAAAAANTLHAELSTKAGDPSIRGTELEKTITALKEAFNPTTFKLGQADAQQLLATLYTSRVSALAARQRLINELTPVLKDAGLSMPKQLDDPKLDATIKEIAKKANETYEQVAQAYTEVAEAPLATDAQKTGGHIGRMFAHYGRAQLARSLNNAKAATDYLAQAREARDLVIQEKGVAAIPAYPSELVPAPTTAPATAPTTTTAPATAPAPAAPAPESSAGLVVNNVAEAGFKYRTGPEWVAVPQPGAPRRAMQLKANHGEGKSKAVLMIQWLPGDPGEAPPPPKTVGTLLWKGLNQAYRGLEKLEDKPAKIGGKDGWYFVYTGATNEGMAIKGTMTAAISGDQLMQIIFVTDPDAYDKEAPLAQKVIDSIVWTR